MLDQTVIEGWPGVMVAMGMGHPLARGFTAAAITAGVAYTMKWPHEAFRRDGSMRPHPALSLSADATTNHFLLTPILVGSVVALCT